ncbi:hypothetical protein L3X38_041825 [Prunus dulcis]|uniref:TTF-type domain-containing protein n=1 Tax=Prunus dulcis TaxID=3755 RepID=A0AAD4YJQ4_PRUDU|nr:hypothetical protein L3X38_041825 [Prunus dulcis]
MERFYKRKSSSISSSDNVGTLGSTSSSRQSDFDEVLANLQADPGLRTRMIDYDSNIRDEIRRAYLQKGPCQPKGHNFPQSNISGINRRFIPKWFDEFDWLKYSISKDAAFCLYCYLFKSNFEQVGSEAFTGAGFKNWKKGRERMKTHVGPDAIDTFFSSNGLSFSKLRGQGYDGASNMRAFVAVAKKNIDIASFFATANSIVNHVGASCKRRDALRAQLQKELVIAFENDCFIMG